MLDRIRIWLPVLLALSANSPYWQGRDTGYASFRSQAWTRFPTAGPDGDLRLGRGVPRARATRWSTRRCCSITA